MLNYVTDLLFIAPPPPITINNMMIVMSKTGKTNLLVKLSQKLNFLKNKVLQKLFSCTCFYQLLTEQGKILFCVPMEKYSFESFASGVLLTFW